MHWIFHLHLITFSITKEHVQNNASGLQAYSFSTVPVYPILLGTACSQTVELCFPGSPLARSTVVTAVKFTIIDQPAPIDSLLKGCIGKHFGTDKYTLRSAASRDLFHPGSAKA